MIADLLWQNALKRFGQSVDIDNDSLAQVLEAYMEEIHEGRQQQQQNVTIPFDLAFAIYKRLQGENKKGRPPTPLLEHLFLDNAVNRGRKRKADLIQGKMPADDAHEKVVQELEDECGRNGINISAATLRNRLYGSK